MEYFEKKYNSIISAKYTMSSCFKYNVHNISLLMVQEYSWVE